MHDNSPHYHSSFLSRLSIGSLTFIYPHEQYTGDTHFLCSLIVWVESSCEQHLECECVCITLSFSLSLSCIGPPQSEKIVEDWIETGVFAYATTRVGGWLFIIQDFILSDAFVDQSDMYI